MTDSGPAVVVAGLTRSFGRQKVLDRVNLRVRTGEIYGLLGPNAAGKTTLIRALVGLVEPDAGTVTVLGKRMPNVEILDQVGYMTQQAALYPDLSVEENVGFFARIYGAQDNVGDALDFVDLRSRRRDAVGSLSGGMRTRVSLACAVVHGPRLLLLDEPTVGVDPQLRVQLWAGFRKMSAAGVTIIVSSHIMDEAERCDRLGMIRAGRLLAEGTSTELKERGGADRLEDAFLRLSAQADH
ncbi:MAG: type transport system ATP-binding protein [Chloroflexota bacterium]|nr:type transport system ATP-binding protein [Chloroflexota bacterium]